VRPDRGFQDLSGLLNLYKINRPSRLRRAIGFDLSYSSTSKASPNDTGIVIIIIIGKVDAGLHSAAIIAQRFLN
jgi:hypothetical protein